MKKPRKEKLPRPGQAGIYGGTYDSELGYGPLGVTPEMGWGEMDRASGPARPAKPDEEESPGAIRRREK